MRVCIFVFLTITFSLFSKDYHNKKALERYDCIVVYQYSKVGSTSLCALFRPLCQTFHTHGPEKINKLLAENKKFLVVNAMRNGFDRHISCFFQHLKRKIEMPENCQVSDLIAIYSEFNAVHTSLTSQWYTQFNQLLDLHTFDHPFDFNKKYYFERKANYDVLILRFEDIAEWPKILEKALHLKNLSLPKQNANKHPLYDEFRKTYRYSAEEAEQILEMDYMQHFYTESELQEMVKKHL